MDREQAIADLMSDKFFNEKLDYFQEAKLIEKLEKQNWRSGAGSVDDIWHGEIKVCPECEKLRVTGCSACGCGNCFTCNYRFRCGPPVETDPFPISVKLRTVGEVKELIKDLPDNQLFV